MPEEPPPRPDWRIAVLLAVLFGPLGLFYATRAGGMLMSFVTLVAGIGTMGVALIFAWPVCILWAYVVTASGEEPPAPDP